MIIPQFWNISQPVMPYTPKLNFQFLSFILNSSQYFIALLIFDESIKYYSYMYVIMHINMLNFWFEVILQCSTSDYKAGHI